LAVMHGGRGQHQATGIWLLATSICSL
jgi:hypothetical protein